MLTAKIAHKPGADHVDIAQAVETWLKASGIKVRFRVMASETEVYADFADGSQLVAKVPSPSRETLTLHFMPMKIAVPAHGAKAPERKL